MIIDLNNMWLPDNLFKDESLLNSFLRCLPRAYGENVELTTVPGKKDMQIILSKPKGYANLNFSELFCDPGARLDYMDKAGIDKAVLSLPCWEEWLDLEMCKKVNDLMAETVKRYPGRYLNLAIVPPWGDKDCLKELERCIYDLGCCGVELAAHYGTLYPDEEAFRAHFKKINQMGVPIRVHHTPMPVEYNYIYKYTNLRRSFGRCTDVMTSLGRILYSGLLEECPNLKFIFTHLAGGFFAFTNMFAPPDMGIKEDVDRVDIIGKKIRGYMEKNIYYDVTSPLRWTKSQLELAVKELGADHVLYSSCYPVRLGGIIKGVQYMQELNIGTKEKSLIMGGNAMRLFNIKK
jgi:predicted TIM-barrel fold metal-dependent hydrolase